MNVTIFVKVVIYRNNLIDLFIREVSKNFYQVCMFRGQAYLFLKLWTILEIYWWKWLCLSFSICVEPDRVTMFVWYRNSQAGEQDLLVILWI